MLFPNLISHRIVMIENNNIDINFARTKQTYIKSKWSFSTNDTQILNNTLTSQRFSENASASSATSSSLQPIWCILFVRLTLVDLVVVIVVVFAFVDVFLLMLLLHIFFVLWSTLDWISKEWCDCTDTVMWMCRHCHKSSTTKEFQRVIFLACCLFYLFCVLYHHQLGDMKNWIVR